MILVTPFSGTRSSGLTRIIVASEPLHDRYALKEEPHEPFDCPIRNPRRRARALRSRFGLGRFGQVRQANTVSGTIIVPDGACPNTPIIGYGPGTHGLGDQCAPSVGLRRGNEFEGGLIHQYAWQGFAVAVTDYEGLGTPGPHTYTVGRAQANAVFDIVRAAQRLPDAGLGRKAPVAIVGYSQGGGTAGWAAETAGGYGPI